MKHDGHVYWILRIWKEKAAVCLKVMFWNLPDRVGKPHRSSVPATSWPTFKASTFSVPVTSPQYDSLERFERCTQGRMRRTGLGRYGQGNTGRIAHPETQFGHISLVESSFCLFPPWRYTAHSGCVFYSPLSGFSLLAYEVTWSHTATRHSW